MRNRGDRREEIFRDELDHRLFLANLGEAGRKAEWQIHAYCLRRHHFHLVLESPRANLVAGRVHQAWIAQHLEMGSWTHDSNLLGAGRKQESLKSEN